VVRQVQRSPPPQPLPGMLCTERRLIGWKGVRATVLCLVVLLPFVSLAIPIDNGSEDLVMSPQSLGYDRYSDVARKTLDLATYEANMGGSHEVLPDHLFMAVIRHGRMVFARFGIRTPLEDWRLRLERELTVEGPARRTRTMHPEEMPPFSESLESVVRESAEFAHQLGASRLELDHLVVGIVLEGSSRAARLLRDEGLTAEIARQAFKKRG
jgi:hypothetical protein